MMRISSWTELPKVDLSEVFRFSILFILSGVFVSFGQPDRLLVFPILSYVFGYSLLFYLLMTLSSKAKRVIAMFIWAWIVELVQVSWMATTHYFGTPILIAYFAITACLAFQFAILAYFLPLNKPLTWVHMAMLASLWTILEWSRLYYFCGFPFNTIGLVLSCNTPSLQIAAVFGVYGLSFWVLFSSLAGAKAFLERGLQGIVIWICLLALPFIAGYYYLEYRLTETKEEKTVRAAMIQTGLFSEEKWEMPGQEEFFVSPLAQWKKTLSYLDESGDSVFHYIVLPEGAFYGDAFEPQYPYAEIIKQLPALVEYAPPVTGKGAEKIGEDQWLVSNAWIAQAISNAYRAEMIVGFLDYDEKTNQSFNSAFHFRPFYQKVERYDKRILVPMSEYLPFSFLGSFLEKYGITNFFTPGKKSKVFQGEIPIAASICFEEGFSGLIRESRLEGAKMFVNITNDAWFPNSRLPKEHFNIGRIRAVENGVFLLRACNTGITAAVDCFGKVMGRLAEYDLDGNIVSGILVAQFNPHSYNTIFSLCGNSLILSVSIGFLIGFNLLQRRKVSKLYLLKKD